MKKFMSLRQFKKIGDIDTYYYFLENNDLPEKYKDVAIDLVVMWPVMSSSKLKWVSDADKLKLNASQIERIVSSIPTYYLVKDQKTHKYECVKSKIKQGNINNLIGEYNNEEDKDVKNSILDSIMMLDINDCTYEHYIHFLNSIENENDRDRLIKNLIDNASDKILVKIVKHTPGLNDEFVSEIYEELRSKAYSFEPNTEYRNFLFMELSINEKDTINKVPKEIKKEVRKDIFDNYDSGKLYNYLKKYHDKMSKSYKAKVIKRILELGDYFYIGILAIEIPDNGIVGKGKLFKDETDAFDTLKNMGVRIYDEIGKLEYAYHEKNKKKFNDKLENYLLKLEDKK